MDAWVPLFESAIWAGLSLYLIYRFTPQLQSLFGAIQERVAAGSSFKAGPVELGSVDFDSLEKVDPSDPVEAVQEDDWTRERNGIYRNNYGLFLAHIVEPPATPGHDYDIFIYLVRHKSEVFDDVEYAEFFLGSHWGNKVYKEQPDNVLMGITTSAAGPFLCTCRVLMKDGTEVRMNRYIDFEMVRVLESKGH